MAGDMVYQSETELNEKPREVDKLPLDLRMSKFLGGEPKYTEQTRGRHAWNMLYSAPIQLDERDQENFVLFEVRDDHTFFRIYVEHPAIVLILE